MILHRVWLTVATSTCCWTSSAFHQPMMASPVELVEAPAPGCPNVLYGELVVYLDIISQGTGERQHHCLALSSGWDIKVPAMDFVPYNGSSDSSWVDANEHSQDFDKCPRNTYAALEEQCSFMGRSVPSGYAGEFGLAPGPTACAMTGDHALYGWSISIVPQHRRVTVDFSSKSSTNKHYLERLDANSVPRIPRGDFELLTRKGIRKVAERIAQHQQSLSSNKPMAAKHSPARMIIVPLRSRKQLELPLRAEPRALPAPLERAGRDGSTSLHTTQQHSVGKELRAIVDPNVEAIFLPGHIQYDLLQRIQPASVHFGRFSITVCETALSLEHWPNLEISFASLNSDAVHINASQYVKKHPDMDECFVVLVAARPWREGDFSVILGRPFLELGHITLIHGHGTDGEASEGPEPCQENGCLVMEPHVSHIQNESPLWSPRSREDDPLTWPDVEIVVKGAVVGAFLCILWMVQLRYGTYSPAHLIRPLLSCSSDESTPSQSLGRGVLHRATALVEKPMSPGNSPSSAIFSIKYWDVVSSNWRSFSDSDKDDFPSVSPPMSQCEL